MLKVGQHVIIADTGHVGTITKIENELSVEVFVTTPKVYSIFVRKHLVQPITDEEYREFTDIPYTTNNYAINHVKDDTRSIEQQIDDIYCCPDGDGWAGIEELLFGECNTKLPNPYILTKPQYKNTDDDKTYLTKDMQNDLKQMYIELALATGDKEWFMELTKEE